LARAPTRLDLTVFMAIPNHHLERMSVVSILRWGKAITLHHVCRVAFREVWFLNTVRVSCFSLGGGEFGEHHRLVENLDRFVHGGQFEHGCFREVAAFGCFPFVMLLDEDRPGKA